MTLEDTVPSNKEQKALGKNEKEDRERDGLDIPESSQNSKKREMLSECGYAEGP